MAFIFYLSALAIAIGGCASPKFCSPTPAAGNLGAGINTAYDEYAPLPRPDGGLWFSATTSEYRNSEADEAVFSTKLFDGFYDSRRQLSVETFYTLKNSAYPSFYPNSYRGEYFFAARGNSGKAGDVDVYYALPPISSFAPNPGVIPGINSDSWDSQPAVSPDGLILIFSSDRKGGKGGLDLWICRRSKTDDLWGKPENFPLNSTFDDMTPHFSPDGELFFATKAISAGNNYDIVAAVKKKEVWQEIRVLPSPINTEYDEISPAVAGDTIYFASNRPDGCGGYDLYAMRLCGPITAKGIVEAKNNKMPLGGLIEVISGGNVIRNATVDDNGRFSVTLPSRDNLVLRYRGSCFPAAAEQNISTPCSENSAIAYDVRFHVPDSMVLFTFEEYNVPFFVSGYYFPNTPENLNALRLQFAYNLIGGDDYSRYIENPGDEYDEYAKEVETALKAAAGFIANRLQFMEKSPCSAGGRYLDITVEGYSDTRRILPNARYGGDAINDAELGITAAKGAPMTNELLSSLRAYNTARWLQGVLAKNPLYTSVKNNIRWLVSGKGIDETIRNDAAKRRVSITIAISEDVAQRGK